MTINTLTDVTIGFEKVGLTLKNMLHCYVLKVFFITWPSTQCMFYEKHGLTHAYSTDLVIIGQVVEFEVFDSPMF